MTDDITAVRARFEQGRCPENHGCNAAKTCVCAFVDMLFDDVEGLRDTLDRREKALRDIEAWARAYPLSVFPEPDLKKAHEVLTANGMTLDAISADAMRHVLDGVINIAKDGLGE